jgi:hypothetical protein
LDSLIPRPKSLGRLFLRLSRFANPGRPALAGAVLGAVTPLIPCGPLYMIFGIALFAGSPAAGAELTLSFGLGTLPLLWFLQSQYFRLRRRFSQVALKVVQRGIAVCAACIILWRLSSGAHMG